MKRKVLYLTAATAMLALGACTGKQANTPAASGDGADQVYTGVMSAGNSDQVYTGVLPAADVDGVRYTVLLDYDDDNAGGDYDMVQTYFESDSTGVNDVATFASQGEFTVSQGENGQKYLKLTGDGAGEMYFLVATDSTLVMTDATMAPVTTPGLNYTLKAAK